MSAYITINGRLARNPESRTTNNGHTLVKLTVPTDSGWGDNKLTTWWTITFFGKSAERAAQHLQKGQRVTITGKASVRSYEKRDGSTDFSADVDGYDWSFAGPKPQAEDDRPLPPPRKAPGRFAIPADVDDGSIPF